MLNSDPKTPAAGSDYDDAHPEQDPAEGSRDVIDHDLAEANAQTGVKSEGEAASSKPGDSGSD